MRTTAHNCVVAYLDILGYVKSVDNAISEHRGDAFLGDLRKAFNRALEELKRFSGDRQAKLQVKGFSDNIVLAIAIRGDAEDELLRMMKIVAGFQAQLSLKGFFLRGAISIGLNYIDKEIVFGEALLDAYRAESKDAVNPRVILAESAVSNLAQHYLRYAEGESPQGKVLQTDVDGKYFVDYLASLADPVGRIAPPYADMDLHKECVSGKLRLNSQDPRVWTKYVWVARYHNTCCERWTLSCKVNEALINGAPKLFHGG